MELVVAILFASLFTVGCLAFFIYGCTEQDLLYIMLSIASLALAFLMFFGWIGCIQYKKAGEKELEQYYKVDIYGFSGEYWGAGNGEDKVFWSIDEGDKIKECEGIAKEYSGDWRLIKGFTACGYPSSDIENRNSQFFKAKEKAS